MQCSQAKSSLAPTLKLNSISVVKTSTGGILGVVFVYDLDNSASPQLVGESVVVVYHVVAVLRALRAYTGRS